MKKEIYLKKSTRDAIKKNMKDDLGLSFKASDLKLVKKRLESFPYDELVFLDDKPNKYGICHLWIETIGLGSSEEKEVRKFINSLQKEVVHDSMKDSNPKYIIYVKTKDNGWRPWGGIDSKVIDNDTLDEFSKRGYTAYSIVPNGEKDYTKGKIVKLKDYGLENIKIPGYRGTWYEIDKKEVNGKTYYLLEHEYYGDETAHLFVEKVGSTFKVLDDESYDLSINELIRDFA